MSTLTELFASKFEVVDANTPELLDTVFRLRYQVYCLETGFENKDEFPDGKEIDHFDALSSHALIRYRENGNAVATVRLVRADMTRAMMPFPMEQEYPGLLASRGYGPSIVPRTSTVEISRFAISRDFKRRAGEPGTIAGIAENSYVLNAERDPNERRIYPHIILGLFLAIVRLSAEAGYTYWVATMEKSLLRLLSRFGIRFRSVGAPIEFHGLRQPCIGYIDEVLEGIFLEREDVWRFITEGGQLWPAPCETSANSLSALGRVVG